jgi:hypothetical protein
MTLVRRQSPFQSPFQSPIRELMTRSRAMHRHSDDTVLRLHAASTGGA